MQWEYTERHGVSVMHLSGYLGRQDAHRFEGALDWVRSHAAGAIVLDMSGLLGWSEEGEAAASKAVHAPIAVCGLRGREAPLLTGCAACVGIYPDLDTALAALASA
ncbi:STAS domain-containing protein [Streptomyces phaeochromogenes]|uniref:hypothetical protein n=1 Tax=Streptomyces TaxID=1883 RepID=UPI0022506C42|nr:hypothetical protein [Streptomyces phaeochromogenes]MCX5604849.1 STAS domain-containing protein [Streptomyces phaeochromogenes]